MIDALPICQFPSFFNPFFVYIYGQLLDTRTFLPSKPMYDLFSTC